MNNPFSGDAKDDDDDGDLLSDGGGDVGDLMQADLEISPLVTSVPPMPGDAGGPSLPRSSKGVTHRLAPKRQKLATDSQFLERSSSSFVAAPRPATAVAAADSATSQLAGTGADSSAVGLREGSTAGSKRPAEDDVEVNGSSANEVFVVDKDEESKRPALPSQPAKDPPRAVVTGASPEAKGLESNVAKAPPVAVNQESSDTTKTTNAAPPSPSSLDNVKKEQRMNLMAIVMGTKSPKKSPPPKAQPPTPIQPKPDSAPKTDTPAPPVVASVAATTTTTTTADAKPAATTSSSKAAPKKARKKAPKPTRRVLIGRKERDMATKLLKGKVDLLDCLPKEDCEFLGKEMWIFTAQQLLSVLDKLSEEEKAKDGEKTKKILELRTELVEELGRHMQREAGVQVPKEVRVPNGSGDNTPGTSDEQRTEITQNEGNSAETPVKASAEGASEIEKARNPFNIPNKQGYVPIAPKPVTEPLLVPKQEPEKMQSDSEVQPLDRNYRESDDDTAPDVVLEEYRERAEAKLKDWQELLKKALKRTDLSDLKKTFPLDGPISILIPKSTQNFVASIKVTTIFDFLSLRRTETGAVCDMMRCWREHCGLTYQNHLALAKHLLGVSFRIESSISSDVPLDKKSRRWMKDPIIVLTGAAREFLVDYLRILTANRFLTTRTKDLSTALATWREEKGLVPLKGSGKVAMVSGWKASAREERVLVTEAGKIVTDVDLEAQSAKDIPIVRDETKTDTKIDSPAAGTTSSASKPLAKKPKPPQPKIQHGYASHSPLFLEHVLGNDVSSFLSTVNISTALDLENVDTSDDSIFCQRLIENKRANDHSSCLELVKKWQSQLHAQLKDMPKDEKPKKVSSPAPVRTPKAAPVRTPKAAPVSERGKHRTPRYLTFSDPFDVLSAVTKVFLATMDINTGKEFLSTRTTDISNEFVRWREEQGKPELKGLGAIASVSGWKAACRKAATDMGLHDIAALEPDSKPIPQTSKGATRSKPRSTATKPPPASTMTPNLPLHDESLLSSGDDLAGKSRIEFAVQNPQDLHGQYVFEISLRRRQAESTPGIFVTYKGSTPIAATRRVSEVHTSGPSLATTETLPILEDVPAVKRQTSIYGQFDFRAPFASSAPGCGLVELSIYGVIPLQNQDLEPLKRVIRYFIFHRAEDATPVGDPQEDYNIIVHRGGPAAIQYFLYVAGPLERGQTLSLRFPTTSSFLCLDKEKEKSLRTAIDKAIGVLSQDDLRETLSWLQSTIYEEVKDLKIEENQSRDNVQDVYQKRRRLSWVGNRTLSLLKKPSNADNEVTKALFFGPRLVATTSEDFDRCYKAEAKEELLASLEHDATGGIPLQTDWCKISRDMFNALVDMLARCHTLSDKEIEERFADMVKEVFNSSFAIGKDTNLADLQTEQPVTDAEETDASGGIACDDRSTRSETKIVFKSLESLSGRWEEVSFRWYRGILWRITSSVLNAFEDTLDETDRKKFKVQELISSLRKDASEADDSLLDFMHVPHSGKVPEELRSMTTNATKIVPGSYQFFLGIVWPALRDCGWRLESGETPSEVFFFPPKSGRRKRASQAKKEGVKKRLRLAREVNKLGWGSVGKLTQRLVVAVAPDAESSKPQKKSAVSVVKTIAQHLDWIQEELNDEGTFCSERAGLISDAVRDCFDEVAPFMSQAAGWATLPKATTGKPSEIYGADAFIHFLLVLPSILRQSSLPLQEISDSLQVVQDLVDFFTTDGGKLLDKRIRPGEEVYVGENKPKSSNLAVRLTLLKPSPASEGTNQSDSKDGSDELTEALLPSDKRGPNGEKLLTDFVTVVMEQVVPCRATEMDAEKKFRRIHVGFPGLACRHCMGAAGEGRYFFSTVESVTTASTVLEKHLLKCSSVPPHIKAQVVATKITHPHQRKDMETGSQQAYFNRLWDRLRSSKIGGRACNIPMTRAARDADADRDDHNTKNIVAADSETLDFQNHLSLLDFVRTTPPWKNNKSIQAALSKYYSCLDYGGRIYQTPSMPRHFSSEWLLAKVVPKRYEYAKAKFLPG